ncbi:endonuclease/exonuclease/phosphatase family protein [Umezawaea sp.]|uniref:endonuclease/exonuclease/phosphatase family protein n=1 Tax=Umezawaea sp. TaxID=1955258 RepID=UPI002ED17B13
MAVEVTFATWNVGGGVTGASHQRHGVPDLDHHAGVLRRFSPDVVCVQEAHEYDLGLGQTADLAARAGYPHSVAVPISPSHLADDARLSLGVLSRYPVADLTHVRFANPGLSAVGPSGEDWSIYDKGYLKATVVIAGRPVTVVNAHCFPLHHFGASPTEARFAPMWEAFGRDLLATAAAAPVLLAVDLNHPSVEDLLGGVVGEGGYSTAFRDVPTTPKGVQQDHILHSGAFRLLDTRVVPTLGDHSYCDARLAF